MLDESNDNVLEIYFWLGIRPQDLNSLISVLVLHLTIYIADSLK